MKTKRVYGIVIGVVVIAAGLLMLWYSNIYLGSSNTFQEEKRFTYDMVTLKMNSEGKFVMKDLLCRSREDGFVMSGDYRLHGPKVFLVYDADLELVFRIEDDSLVFDRKHSKGLERLGVLDFPEGTVWDPSDL